MKKQSTLEVYAWPAKSALVACFMLLFNMQLSAQYHACSAHFYYGPDSTVNGVKFFSAMNSQSTHYSWDFGDGNTSTMKNPKHVYSSAGKYYVCLTVIDTNYYGVCTDKWCDSVYAGPPPPPPPPVCNAHFVWNQLYNYPTIHFDNAQNPYGSTYSWNFGDGKTGTGNDPNHTYASGGTYYVCLTVKDSTSSGSCTDTYCDSVHVNGPPPPPPPVCNASFTWKKDYYKPNKICFDNVQNPYGSHYSWTFGDSTTSTNQDPCHTYLNAGVYYVCLTVTDSTSSGTCSDTYCDSVHVTLPPPPPPPVCNASFTWKKDNYKPNKICFDNVQNPYGSHFSWTFGDSTTSTNQDPCHTYTSSGVYYICLTVTNSTLSGTCSNTYCDSVYITLPPPPPPPVCNASFIWKTDKYHPNRICFDNAQNPYGSHYSWTFGDSTTSTYQDPCHTYLSPGTYVVCLTVTDSTSSGTCSSTFCDSVVIGTPPPPKCDAHFHYVGYGNNFFSAPNPPGTTYQWSFGDGFTSTAANPKHVYANPGTYYVCLTVKDSTPYGTCSDTQCDSVRIGPPPPPPPHHHQHCKPYFRYFPDSIPFTMHFLHAFNRPNTTYFWSFGDSTTSTLPNPTHTFPDSGVYYVCLTVRDSSSSGICTKTRCDSVCVGLVRCWRPHWWHHKLAGEFETEEIPSAIVYPNPVVESATLHIENTTGIVTFKLYEITGRLAMTKENLSNGDFQLDKKDLNRGIYFYEITTSGTSDIIKGKMIIQ